MKRLVTGSILLGMALVAQANSVQPDGAQPAPGLASPDAMMREMVTPDDLRFFLNEARQAARSAAKGEAYVPAPQTAMRAKEVGERMREKGFGLMEVLLDQIERELMKEFSPPAGAAPRSMPERVQL